MTEAYVEKTQKELGAIISSPKLTEKLLSKPPFRFLHDIVTNFISATGFPQGLFPDELLDSNNVTDKAKKIEFLTLLIAGVEAATGTKVTANPSKIVAGHEADHTNALLQQLASCAALSPGKKAAAVQKVKGGGEGEQPSAARKSSRKEDEENAEKEKQEKEQQQQQQQQKDEERRKRKEEAKKREQEASAAAAAAEITKRHGTDEKKKRREDEAPAPSGETNEAERRKPQEEEARRSSKQRKGDDGHGARQEEGGEGKRKGGETLEDKTPKTEDDERRKRHEERRRREKEAAAAGAEKEDSLGNTERTVALSRTARSEQRSSSTTNATATTTSTTTAAGKAPPRTKPTHEVMDGTQVGATPVPGVIQESKSKKNKTAQDAVDENEWMRVAEQQEAKPVTTGGGINTGGANEGEAKGYLGQQALKAKRDQEEEAARRAEEAKASALQGGGGGGGIIIHSSKGGKSGSTMAEGELSKLREQLQLLTKASNPLGKLLEAIYDDIDTMGRELEMWRSEARSQALAAADAKRQTMESLQEVHAQLQNLEDAINDQILKTHNIRRNVINNDNAVAGMVRMIVSPDIGR